jgi:arsenate reductase
VKNVLFVCVHNSGRSQMAEAFFNRLAEGRATAASAGSQPDDAVDPTVVEVMWEVGIDISGKVPRRLTPEIVDAADRVVIMGCGVEAACPVTFVETEDWGLDDPKGQPIEVVRRIRDEIRARVENLIGELNP